MTFRTLDEAGDLRGKRALGRAEVRLRLAIAALFLFAAPAGLGAATVVWSLQSAPTPRDLLLSTATVDLIAAVGWLVGFALTLRRLLATAGALSSHAQPGSRLQPFALVLCLVLFAGAASVALDQLDRETPTDCLTQSGLTAC